MNTEDTALAEGVLARNMRALAKAVTLTESTRPDHQQRAQNLLRTLLPHTGRSIRVGITGVPGVGKSTFIEALGLHLLDQGHRVAVLAVDPSSSVSGGSILGDKTRMEQLSRAPNAYIRPSPARDELGGVASHTREAILLSEAAGFDVIIVETVGVGQSETAVAGMTDSFVLLQLANAGDDLQAIKKGVVELADLIVYNKADIDAAATGTAMSQMKNALLLLRSVSPHWRPQVLSASAATGGGIAAFWQTVLEHRAALDAAGELTVKRQRQALDWMWALIERGLRTRFEDCAAVRGVLEETCDAVSAGNIAPVEAAAALLGRFARQPIDDRTRHIADEFNG